MSPFAVSGGIQQFTHRPLPGYIELVEEKLLSRSYKAGELALGISLATKV